MPNQFLCPTHRQWVYLHPLEAIAHIQEAKTQGEALRIEERWSEALPYIGSALEMTEIIMDINHARCERYGLLYTALAISVADTQSRLANPLSATTTLQNSENWLRSLCCEIGSQAPLSKGLLDCLNTLHKGVEFFRESAQRHTHQHSSVKLH